MTLCIWLNIVTWLALIPTWVILIKTCGVIKHQDYLYYKENE